MERREKQILAMETSQMRWDGWTTLVSQGFLVPNFTSTGFAVMKAPEWAHSRLKAKLHEKLAAARTEDTPTSQIDVIGGEQRPLFIPGGPLNHEVLQGLRGLHEEWAGVELVPAIAYGLRVYRNQSNLLMHIDKVEDHVISRCESQVVLSQRGVPTLLASQPV